MHPDPKNPSLQESLLKGESRFGQQDEEAGQPVLHQPDEEEEGSLKVLRLVIAENKKVLVDYRHPQANLKQRDLDLFEKLLPIIDNGKTIYPKDE
jgi:hypothetical protein